MPRLAPDSTISHYKIKELIASGGMGEVYRAIDLQLGRLIALKTILPIKADDPRASHRFLREARSASILSHPSICTVYEIGQEGDLTFIAMQYIAGQSIQDILSRQRLSIEKALSYALDVADALDEAHRRGVIHRDIKPSNILVNERDVAVVLDFGLAKQISFEATLNEELPTLLQSSTTATLVGTVPYMPPEELRGEPLDERSDIFSFGVTLYEMLTGIRPFDRPTKVDVMHAILHDEPKPLTELRPEIDARLGAIIEKALRKDPIERYQSISELKQEIVVYIQESGYVVRGVASASASGKATTFSPNGRMKVRAGLRSMSSLIIALLSLVLIVLVVMVGAIWRLAGRSGNKPDSELLLSLRHVELMSWKSEPREGDIFSALSRDGTMVAYSAISGGHSSIWIKQTSGGNPVQVTKDDWSSQNPIWSPDNQQIAFVSNRGDQICIWRMPALGGTPKLVAPIRNPQLKRWSKDGGTIYYESHPNLYALNITSGQTTQVTNFEPSQHLNELNFSISPNEDRIAYSDQKDGQSDIWVVPMSGSTPLRVTNDQAEDRNPVWHADGTRIIYSSLRNGTFQICVAYLDGRQPLQITSGESDKFVSDVSADGNKILYSAAREESDIWGVKVESGEEFQVTSDIGSELWPDVSPNNKTIAYQAIRDPGQGRKLNDCSILIRPIQTGSEPIQVATGRDPRWSPDGSRLAFVRASSTGLNIWTVRSTGIDEKQITTDGIFGGDTTMMPYKRKQTKDYSWSPDGQSLIYCSGNPQDEGNVSIISADGSGAVRIINSSKADSFYCPLWSAAGDFVIYSSQAKTRTPDGKAVWKVWLTETKTGKSEIIFQGDSELRLLGWADKDVIVATIEGSPASSTNESQVSLLRVGLLGSGGRPFARLNSTYLENTQLSPDGRVTAFTSHQDGRDNIWLSPTGGGNARKITSNTDPKLYFSSMAFSPDGKTIYYGRQSRYSLISAIENFK